MCSSDLQRHAHQHQRNLPPPLSAPTYFLPTPQRIRASTVAPAPQQSVSDVSATQCEPRRLNPENGRTLGDYREQKRAQSWALDYEHSQDLVRCERREANAIAREALRANDNNREAEPLVLLSQQPEQKPTQEHAHGHARLIRPSLQTQS